MGLTATHSLAFSVQKKTASISRGRFHLPILFLPISIFYFRLSIFSLRPRSRRQFRFRSRRQFALLPLQHLLFPVHQRIDVVRGQFESVSVRNRVRRASLHAISAEYAPRIIDVIDLRVTLARRDPLLLGIFSRLDINAVGWARRRAQKTSHALLQTAFVAVQHVNPAIPRLKS